MASAFGTDLAVQLENARKEIDYYKLLAAEAARIRLRETEELSSLVDQLREAKKDLEQERLRFQTLVDEAPYGLVVISPSGQLLYANPKFLEMFGYDLSEIPQGRDWFRKAFPDADYRHQVISTWVRDSAAALLEKNRPRIFTVTCKEGQEKIIQFNAVRLPSGEDLVTCEDISGRISAERKMSEQYTMISSIFENASEGICVCHKVNEYPFVRFTHWNRRMHELTGYSMDEINDLGWCQTMYPDPGVQDMAFGRMARLREGDDLKNEEWTVTTKNCQQRVFSISTAPLTGMKGQARILAVMRDTTEQKKAEEKLRESESNFRSFFEAMGDMIIVGTPDGHILYSNPAATRKLGYTPDEFRTMQILDLHPEALRNEAETILNSMLSGDREICPLPLKTKAGASLPVETRVWYGEWSGLDCIFGIFKDLSKEQEALQKFDRFFHNNPAPMAVSTIPERRFADVNDAFLHTLGFARKEVIGETSAELGLFADLEQQWAVSHDVQAQGRISGIELEVRRRDGAVIHGLFSGEVIDIQGMKYFLTIMLDITDRKRAEQALERSRAELAAIFDSVSDAIVVTDVERRIVMVNRAFSSIWGYRSEEVIGKSTQFLYADETDYLELGKKRYNVSVGGPLPALEMMYRRKDGSSFPAESLGSMMKSGEGTVIGFIGVHRDITERLKAEEALRFTQFVVDHMQDSVFLARPDGSFCYVNNGSSTTLGYTKDELLALGIPDVDTNYSLEDLQPMWQSIRQDGSTMFQTHHRTKMGQVFPVEVRTDHINFKGEEYICALARDISERKRREEIELEAARLRSVAELSAGVAHHFNNLLQVVMGSAGLALDDIDSGNLAEARSYLRKMLPVAARGAEIVKRLQIFAQALGDMAPGERTIFDVSATVRNAVVESKPLWLTNIEKRGAKIDIQLGLEDGCVIEGLENEISEVVFNLWRNATEALLDDGIIEIKTFKEGDNVVLTVRDTGHGISEQNLPHIFQPFWTTKGFDIGKGMGLAVAYGLVKRNGGDLSVASRVGNGTIFTVRLPLSREQVIEATEPTVTDPKKSLTILVIEDEEPVALLLETILAKAGHKVLTAFSGREGLSVFEKDRVDLVLSDLGMQDMSGWEVGTAIRSICTEKGITKPPFVLLTGWRGKELEKQKIAESGTDAVIAKPISPSALASTIQQIAGRFKIRPQGAEDRC